MTMPPYYNTCMVILCVIAVVTAVRGQSSELKFLSLGDWGEHLLPGQAQVADSMALWAETNQVAFVLTSGDNFYPSGIKGVNDPQIDNQWRYVYNHSSLEDLPWYISVGNHDYGNDRGEEWNQVALSELEPRWILPHLWYDFTEQLNGFSVHFIIIDTEALRMQVNNYTTMLTWLDTTLSQSTARWKVVVGHRPIFSTGDYGPISSTNYNVIRPLLEQHEADFFICGHDHNLQHIQHSAGGGVDYIVSGAGGALVYNYDPEAEAILNSQYNMTVSFVQVTWGFLAATVTNEGFHLDFYSHKAELIYSYTRQK